MKKWMNSIFFGSCLIAAILIEALSIQILKDNLFITTGLGIIVLITGYLFMESIRRFVIQSRDGAKFYMDRILGEETEKWNERYTETVNLQKATYTATKKNTALIAEQFDEILTRLEKLENNNEKAWQKITELQKKALEGQKNALNLEISYNKENTKRLIGLVRGEDNDISGQITKLLSLLEKNNELLQSGINLSERTGGPEDKRTEEYHQDPDTADHTEKQAPEDENTSESDWSIKNEPEAEAAGTLDSNNIYEAEDTSKTIAANEEDSYAGNASEADTYAEDTSEADTYAEDISEAADAADENSAVNSSYEEGTNNAADVSEDTPVIKPLYDDPNKSLTADEIAALFASFGK